MSKLEHQDRANQKSEAGMFYPTGFIVAGFPWLALSNFVVALGFLVLMVWGTSSHNLPRLRLGTHVTLGWGLAAPEAAFVTVAASVAAVVRLAVPLAVASVLVPALAAVLSSKSV